MERVQLVNKSIRSYLLIYMGVFVVLPLCLAFLFLNFYLQRVNTANKKSSDFTMISQIKDNADQMIEVSNYVTSMMMTNTTVVKDLQKLEAGSEAYEEYLSKEELSDRIMELESSVLNAVGGKLAVLTNKGYLIGAYNISRTNVSYKGEDWFEEILKNGRKATFCNGVEAFFSEMILAGAKDRDYLYIGRGIYDYSGKRLGVILIQISDSNIWGKFTDSISIEEEGALYLIGADNKVLMAYNDKYEEDIPGFKIKEGEADTGDRIIEGISRQGYYYISTLLAERGNQLIYVVPRRVHFKDNDRIFFQIIMMGGIVIAFSVFAMNYVSRRISRPLIDVAKALEGDQGELIKLEQSERNFSELEKFIINYNKNTDQIAELIEQVKQESRLKEKNRYEMLMSQISPHFIFNTVNSIKIMTIDERTRNALEDLGDILHAVYDNRDGMTTVGQEISMLESYVKIMQMRFGNSFLYYNTVPTSLYLYEMPAFSLQPLVENAILHGVKDVHAGQIIVSAVEYEWDYIISVFNNGNSAEKEKIEKILQEPYNKRALTGIGLYNVDSRLKMLYGKSYGLIFNEQVRSGFEIWLRLPKKLIRDESGKQKNGDVQIIDS